jgi:RNA polymerase sigma factor (TIGR02999 family)
MSEVTQILSQIDAGDPSAAEKLLPLIYDELRKLAAARMAVESPDHTLQATALVHEAYLRLVGSKQPQQWNGRSHFFGAAAEAMRRILIESARRKKGFSVAVETGRVEFPSSDAVALDNVDNLLMVNDALSRLEREDALAANVVKLRFFAGLTVPETAEALGISPRTAERNWTYARTWLHRALSTGPG